MSLFLTVSKNSCASFSTFSFFILGRLLFFFSLCPFVSAFAFLFVSFAFSLFASGSLCFCSFYVLCYGIFCPFFPPDSYRFSCNSVSPSLSLLYTVGGRPFPLPPLPLSSRRFECTGHNGSWVQVRLQISIDSLEAASCGADFVEWFWKIQP